MCTLQPWPSLFQILPELCLGSSASPCGLCLELKAVISEGLVLLLTGSLPVSSLTQTQVPSRALLEFGGLNWALVLCARAGGKSQVCYCIIPHVSGPWMNLYL